MKKRTIHMHIYIYKIKLAMKTYDQIIQMIYTKRKLSHIRVIL